MAEEKSVAAYGGKLCILDFSCAYVKYMILIVLMIVQRHFEGYCP